MKWKQLAALIAAMPEEQQETDATVLLMDSDQVCPVMDFVTSWLLHPNREAVGIDQVEDVLDHEHPYLTVAG